MHRSTRTALGVAITLGVILLGVTVLLRPWRGLKPAVAPPPTPISNLSPAKLPTVAPASPVLPRGPKPNFPLTLPDGFDITLYASGLQRPRVLALDPQGTPLVSDTEANAVFALPDDNRDGSSDGNVPVLQGLNKPHGLAFRGAELFVAETDKVVRYHYDAAKRRATDPQTLLALCPAAAATSRAPSPLVPTACCTCPSAPAATSAASATSGARRFSA